VTSRFGHMGVYGSLRAYSRLIIGSVGVIRIAKFFQCWRRISIVEAPGDWVIKVSIMDEPGKLNVSNVPKRLV